MKKLIYTLTILYSIASFGQTTIGFKTKKNESIDFEISKNSIYIGNKDNTAKLNQEKIIKSGTDFKIIETTENEYADKLKKVKTENASVEPILIYKDGAKQICRSEIIIKINPNENLETILKGIDFSAAKNDFVSNQYLVKINNYDTFQIFELINSLTNDKRIEFIEPNFLILNSIKTIDEFYTSQYSINNNGYLGGTVDADMDVDDAWAYSTGTGIKVAVLDTGVDLAHLDLQANLLPGRDAVYNTAGGGFVDSSFHGTACAGIIGAVGNNSIGTVGIAYGAKIIPIRVGTDSGGISNAAAADGINWAWQNGADILSNSWGGGSPSTAVTAAIDSATTSGRDGKGCVVLFASGNCNTAVSYPASLPNVIAVGASNQCDKRKSPNSCDGETWVMSNCSVGGSNYGTNLDIVAPGVKIYTTDVSGSSGYSSTDYFASFNGTSSACPNAAGVMALILSIKPSLTNAEARQVLEISTDKVSGYSYTAGVSGQPNGTWNNEVGYGRINALKAMKVLSPYELYGGNNVCNAPSQTFVGITPTPPAGSIITWTTSSNLIVSSTLPPSTSNTPQVLVQGTLAPGVYQTGTVRAIINGVTSPVRTVNVGQKPFSFSTQKSTAYTEHCDPTHHYVAIDVINSDASMNYNYTFGNFMTGIANPGVTYTQLNPTRFLFKIPLNKIPSGPNPVFGFSLSTTGACNTTPSTNYGLIVVLKPCNSSFALAKLETDASSESTNTYTVYPNPATDVLNISLNDSKNNLTKNALITGELFDLNGHQLTKVAIIGSTATLDVSKFKKGIYVLKININGIYESHQVIIN